MTMIITDECINCGACAVECPTEAIYEPEQSYQINNNIYKPVSEDHFFIVTEICNECAGYNKIRCISICPMDAIRSR